MVLLHAGGGPFKLMRCWPMVKAKENLTDVDSGICKARITMLDLFPEIFFSNQECR